MGYQLCLFGAPATVDVGTIIDELGPMARELRRENRYGGVYAAMSSDDDARASGIRIIYLAATPAPRGRVSRDFFTERWSGGELTVLVYDDKHGLYLWERHSAGGRREGILNDGHRIGTRNVTLAVDYPQKGFTNAQLDAALDKPEDEMTDAEARAVMDWHDAITIGFAHAGITKKKSSCLDVLYAKTAWNLLEGGEQAMPDDAGPIVDPYIEAHEFASYELESRDY